MNAARTGTDIHSLMKHRQVLRLILTIECVCIAAIGAIVYYIWGEGGSNALGFWKHLLVLCSIFTITFAAPVGVVLWLLRGVNRKLDEARRQSGSIRPPD